MYKLQDWAAVQKVYAQTHSKRMTAQILGMSRNTLPSVENECQTGSSVAAGLAGSDDPALTRDCSYYETNAMKEASGGSPKE